MTFDGEGSVQVDGMATGQAEDTTETTTEDTQTTETKEETADTDGDKTEETVENPDDKAEGEADDQKNGKTDKGTKLAEDPLQRANQLRANAESRAKQYEQVLNDPKTLRAYLTELEKEQGIAAETTTTDAPKLEGMPEKFETPEDYQQAIRVLAQKLDDVTSQFQQSKQTQEQRDTQTYWQTESQAVLGKYPELRETNEDGTPNPDFDSDLAEAFDDQLAIAADIRMVNGQPVPQRKIDVKRFAENFMRARKRGEADGSRRAQTIVKDKRNGRVITGGTGKADEPDVSQMSGPELIAYRIRQAAQKANKQTRS